jgi:hypothetical protein
VFAHDAGLSRRFAHAGTPRSLPVASDDLLNLDVLGSIAAKPPAPLLFDDDALDDSFDGGLIVDVLHNALFDDLTLDDALAGGNDAFDDPHSLARSVVVDNGQALHVARLHDAFDDALDDRIGVRVLQLLGALAVALGTRLRRGERQEDHDADDKRDGA